MHHFDASGLVAQASEQGRDVDVAPSEEWVGQSLLLGFVFTFQALFRYNQAIAGGVDDALSPYAGLCRPLPAFAAVKGQEKGNVPDATRGFHFLLLYATDILYLASGALKTITLEPDDEVPEHRICPCRYRGSARRPRSSRIPGEMAI
jgi:hypothetical protein